MCPLILKYLLLALAGPCHLREQALERGVLVQLVLLHQPAQVARRGRQLDLWRRRWQRWQRTRWRYRGRRSIGYSIWKIDIRIGKLSSTLPILKLVHFYLHTEIQRNSNWYCGYDQYCDTVFVSYMKLFVYFHLYLHVYICICIWIWIWHGPRMVWLSVTLSCVSVIWSCFGVLVPIKCWLFISRKSI